MEIRPILTSIITFVKGKTGNTLIPKSFPYGAMAESYRGKTEKGLAKFRKNYAFRLTKDLSKFAVPQELQGLHSIGSLDEDEKPCAFLEYGFYLYQTDDVDILLIPHFLSDKIAAVPITYEWHYLNRKCLQWHKAYRFTHDLNEVLADIQQFEQTLS